MRRIGRLLDLGLEAGVQVPQDTGLLQLDQRALATVLSLLDGSIDALADVATACDQEIRVDEAEVTLPPSQLGDLAFVGRSELVEIRGTLQASIDRDSKWQIAAQADRAAGRSVRALLPVESALREYSGLEAEKRSWFDLEDTLAIRRRFVCFWLEVRRIEAPQNQDIEPALGKVAGMIADLRQDPIYPFLRLDDRLDLRALQKRILAWLDGSRGEESEEAEAGLRLWQDASGFFNLLMQIQRREELREHDLVQLGRVLRKLHDAGDEELDAKEYAEVRELLLDMASREAAIDAILLDEAPRSVKQVESAVRKLHSKLLKR